MLRAEIFPNFVQWPTDMIRSRDAARGQGLWNRHRKCMESAKSAVQIQL